MLYFLDEVNKSTYRNGSGKKECLTVEVKKSELSEYLDLSKKMELEYSGMEADDEIESMEDGEPYDVQNIRIDQKMVTVFLGEHWISAENGVRLNLSPEYQRNMVWDGARKRALIESLLLRIPLTAFYLDEDSAGNKCVIDRMQR